uniref:Uncharacterized protein n=1 Tax=Solibacter usitatus (strain Ellin6076) TaxID=234267 RepID=Q01WQ9_SOLUE
MNKKKIAKSIKWTLYAFTIAGSVYMLTYVFPRLAQDEERSSAVTRKAASAPRPCLELTSDQDASINGYGRIHGWVRNNCEKRYNYVEVEYRLYDAGGDVVGGAMTNLAALGPHESWKFEAIAMQPYKRYQLAHVVGD